MRANRSHGLARPSPIISMMPNSATSDCDKPKLTAVPTKGAEQGVASKVASIPAPKSDSNPGDELRAGIIFAAKAGVRNVNISNSDRVKSPIITAITPRKIGFWNWIPQPICAPAKRNAARLAARIRKELIMPAAEAKNRRLIRLRVAPANWITDATFSDRTGNTHGMKFKITPPRKAMSHRGRDDVCCTASLESATPPTRTSVSKNWLLASTVAVIAASEARASPDSCAIK